METVAWYEVAIINSNHDFNNYVYERIPFYYNLPYYYKKEFLYQQNKYINQYENNPHASLFEKYNIFINTTFPILPINSRHKARMFYITPGAIHIGVSKYDIKFVND